jgi:caa(3)-type oxidase subunit IV
VAAPTHGESHDAFDQGGEAHGDRFYWIVAAVLTVVTIVEVVITLVGLPPIVVLPALLLLSVVKGAAVVMYFMHLKGDARIFKFVFIVPLAFAVTLCLSFLTLFANYGGIAG